MSPPNPNEYAPPKTREPLPLHVAMTPAEIVVYWREHAPQARKRRPSGAMVNPIAIPEGEVVDK